MMRIFLHCWCIMGLLVLYIRYLLLCRQEEQSHQQQWENVLMCFFLAEGVIRLLPADACSTSNGRLWHVSCLRSWKGQGAYRSQLQRICACHVDWGAARSPSCYTAQCTGGWCYVACCLAWGDVYEHTGEDVLWCILPEMLNEAECSKLRQLRSSRLRPRPEARG